MVNRGKGIAKVKPVKVHEPKCPSRIIQMRPKYDLRLLLNKKKQQQISGNSNQVVGINKKVNFQIDRRVKMSRQEVYVTVFENASGEVKNKVSVSKNIVSETKEKSYTICKEILPEVEKRSKPTAIKRDKKIHPLMLDKSNKSESNQNKSNKSQICLVEKESSIHYTTPTKTLKQDGSNDKGASEDESTSSDDDDEQQTRKQHPNRRLFLEKPTETPNFDFGTSTKQYLSQNQNNYHKNVTTNKRKSTEQAIEPHKKLLTGTNVDVQSTSQGFVSKSPDVPFEVEEASSRSTMWEQVLRKSDLWKREDCWCQGKINYETAERRESEDSFNDFLHLLETTTKALDESSEPFSSYIQQDPAFYIPPAHAYLLWWKLTEDMTPVESVEQVCKVRRWPLPEYKLTQDPTGGWTASLLLHGRSFSSNKPAVTTELAKQVAAQELLQWLNLQPRPSPHPSLFTRTSFED